MPTHAQTEQSTATKWKAAWSQKVMQHQEVFEVVLLFDHHTSCMWTRISHSIANICNYRVLNGKHIKGPWGGLVWLEKCLPCRNGDLIQSPESTFNNNNNNNENNSSQMQWHILVPCWGIGDRWLPGQPAQSTGQVLGHKKVRGT